MLYLRSFSSKLQDRAVVLSLLKGDPTCSLSLRLQVCHPTTRMIVALLGPCFKTGRLNPFCQQPFPLPAGTFRHSQASDLGENPQVQDTYKRPPYQRDSKEAVLNPAGRPHKMGYKFPKTTFPPKDLCARQNCCWLAKASKKLTRATIDSNVSLSAISRTI